MEKDTLVLPSLSPVGDKPISVMINDRYTSADGGVLLFQDVERRLNLANRLAACLHDPRQPGKITHALDDILRFRILAIVAGYPDGNDCDVLRDDPAFKMALDRPPVSGPALCSQPTVSRIENLARRTELYRMAEAMLDLYCDSFPVVPHHLTLDLDESFDRVHGEQELRKFNAYYDDWGFLPIHIFDTSGRLVLSVLREAATPSGREILALVKRLVGHLRERFPRVRIRLRGDPVFKMALHRSRLCSQPSRIENMPRRTELYRMAQAMLDLYCDSFPVVPSHLTLDLDESFDRVHGEQELRKFNAYYDDWGFLPIHIFDTSGRLVLSVLREAATPSEILTLVKRVVCASGSPGSVCAATATMPVRK